MNFHQRALSYVNQIPTGKVATYGQIAALAGSPRAARQVGFALRRLTINENHVPWWRVINSQGYISINHGGGPEKVIQRDLLEAEGIIVNDALHIDLATYLWRPIKTVRDE